MYICIYVYMYILYIYTYMYVIYIHIYIIYISLPFLLCHMMAMSIKTTRNSVLHCLGKQHLGSRVTRASAPVNVAASGSWRWSS